MDFIVCHSVDSGEVAKFSRMAADWWRADGEMAPLHDMNPIRVSFIRSHCEQHFASRPLPLSPLSTTSNSVQLPRYQPLRGLRMLDIGCGAGLLTEVIYLTIISPSFIELTRKCWCSHWHA
jgi:2-polyprenyl-6-hydroxyphenyl methylase/3-demethylubiquinone-9 3-methyltransferase